MSASDCVPLASDALTNDPATQCVCASRPIGTQTQTQSQSPTRRERKLETRTHSHDDDADR
jgi:hypothetical protein